MRILPEPRLCRAMPTSGLQHRTNRITPHQFPKVLLSNFSNTAMGLLGRLINTILIPRREMHTGVRREDTTRGSRVREDWVVTLFRLCNSIRIQGTTWVHMLQTVLHRQKMTVSGVKHNFELCSLETAA